MSFEIYEPTEEERRRMLLDAEVERLEAKWAVVAARFTGSDPTPPTAEDVEAIRLMPLHYSMTTIVESLAHILRRLDELERTGPVDR